MARRRTIAAFPSCPRCGAQALHRDARFCGHCGASLTDTSSDLPDWQQPAPAKYSHVSMPRMALSCPECGEPMRFGFRKVCRQCGAKLVMVPRLFHPYHVQFYVAGPTAALTALGVGVIHLAIVFAGLVLLAKACGQ